MKKLPAFIIAGAMALTLTTAASAHCMRASGSSAHCARTSSSSVCSTDACARCGYVNRWLDEDNDGICDYHLDVCANGEGNCDSDGDGICDYCGKDCLYIDEDGNGVCDSYQKHTCVSTHHSRGHCHKSHHGC